MTDWKPIETAPKDGTVIDLWRGANSSRLTDAHWRDGKWWWKHYRYDEAEDQITHWMPLPTPPRIPKSLIDTEHLERRSNQ